MNYKIIAYTLGWVLNIESAFLLLPLLCSFIYNDGCAPAYIIGIVLCLAAGILLTVKKPVNKAMYSEEGFITVALSWIALSLFGCVPFLVSGYIPNFADAFFETVSGFTTTGASILNDVEALPESLLMWRSVTHWMGGMGVLVFLVAIVPLSGGGNVHLIRAESTGPSVSKLVPKVKSTAKILYLLYIGFTLLELILLLFGGMTFFEALNTSFATAGTGGFGIYNSSIAGFSPYIQYVVAVFMIIFGVDFSVYYLLIIKRMGKALLSLEFRTYIAIIASAILLIGINCRHLYGTVEETFRYSAFQVASLISSTGYVTMDFDLWPSFSKTILVLLMFIGACAGSTGGGIKVSRVIILIKSIGKEIKIATHPRLMHRISMNGKTIEHETVRSVSVFVLAYIVIFAFVLLVISLDGFDFTTNFTAVTTTINNMGPGLAGVGPTRNFSEFSALSKLVFSINMLIGRLEIFPMLVLLTPKAIRK